MEIPHLKVSVLPFCLVWEMVHSFQTFKRVVLKAFIFPNTLSKHWMRFQRSVNGSPLSHGLLHYCSESLLSFFTSVVLVAGNTEMSVSYAVSILQRALSIQ